MNDESYVNADRFGAKEQFDDYNGNLQKIDALLELIELSEQGFIYHNFSTGEEWLGINNEAKIRIGKGQRSDWANYNGEDNDLDLQNIKNYSPMDGVKSEDVYFPSESGPGLIAESCFVKKNTDAGSPVNEYACSLNDFEMNEVNDTIFFTVIRPY